MKPVSDTAFYCCGVRMVDAESTRPVLGDVYARRFMDGRGTDVFEQFRRFKGPNASNVARARMIDDLIRQDLAGDPTRLVVTIGAGFDTRPYRLGSGSWLEMDEPAVMAFKEERLPSAECVRPLTRVPIEFDRESLAGKLDPWARADSATVVVEGVFMYLPDEARRATLSAIADAFPGGVLLLDLVTRRFHERYSGPIHRLLADMGASWQDLSDEPERVALELGYQSLGSWSVVNAARDFGNLKIPRILLKTLLAALANDYRVHRFRAPSHTP